METNQCKGITKKGERCKRLTNDSYCFKHNKIEDNLEIDEIKTSWVLEALKYLLNDGVQRNYILSNSIEMKNIVNGETFGYRETNEELKKYLKYILTIKNKYVIFTACNIPDVKFLETHYISYIIDNLDKKVYVADPAYTPNDLERVYYGGETEELIIDFFKKNKYEILPIKVSTTCQRDANDVFCQTWSLILVINAIKSPEKVINIPKSKLERYGILLKFWKNVMKDKYNCKEFTKIYNELFKKPVQQYDIKKKKYYTDYIDKSNYVKNPCKYLELLCEKDIE